MNKIIETYTEDSNSSFVQLEIKDVNDQTIFGPSTFDLNNQQHMTSYFSTVDNLLGGPIKRPKRPPKS